MQRRSFFLSTTAAGLGSVFNPNSFLKGTINSLKKTHNLSLCLNAFSFNKLLRSGQMTIDDLFQFAADTGFRGVDLTAYYIKGYPEVPSDKELFEIKRKAFRLGLAISGTGVRNDFTLVDPLKRKAQIKLVKDWIKAASKLGAPHVRVFDGRMKPSSHPRSKVLSWIIDGFKECADFASEYGVMVAYQNHNDFVVVAEEVVKIMDSIDSKWFGLMLDIGSLPSSDPYKEIEKLIPYAITWQVKEQLTTDRGRVDTDFERLMPLVLKSNYRGFFPLETLGAGDPYEKVKLLYEKVQQHL